MREPEKTKIEISTDKDKYKSGETVIISVSGFLSPVAIEVRSPSGKVVYVGQKSDPIFSLSFKLGSDAELGTYTAHATAANNSTIAETTFSVRSGLVVKTLKIEGFRGIKDCKEPIKLSNFTVIIGRNNSGKTSILEALSLLSWNNESEAFENGGLNPLPFLYKLHGSGSASSLIYGYHGEANIEFTNDLSQVKVKFSEVGSISLFINGKSITWPDDCEILTKTLGIEPSIEKDISSRLNNSILFFPINSEITSKLIDRIEDKFHRFVADGAHVRVIEILNRCVDEEFTEVLVVVRNLCVRKELEHVPIYPMVKDQGDGAERFLAMALWLELLKPQLVMIDDLEASAHPSLIREMLSWLSEKEWQVVLTTHSIDVLHELTEIHPRGCKIIQLKRKEDILLHQSLDLDELEVLLENNTDPRMLVSALGL